MGTVIHDIGLGSGRPPDLREFSIRRWLRRSYCIVDLGGDR